MLGGEGLIGKELVKTLRLKGHSVISLDLKTGTDLAYGGRTCSEWRCDRVWFLAWDTGGAKYISSDEYQHQQFMNNCRLSANVFDILVQTKLPFMFVTSQLAARKDAYGLTKQMAEHWAEHLDGKVARLWNVYGWENPDIRSHVMTDFVVSGLVDGKVKCKTNGKERRRFLYKSDCVNALIDLFDGTHTKSDIAGGKWYSVKDIAEKVANQLGVGVEMGSVEGEELITDPKNTTPSTVSLNEGIQCVIEEGRKYLRCN